MKTIYELYEAYFQKKISSSELENLLRTHEGAIDSPRQFAILHRITDHNDCDHWALDGVYSGANLRDALEKYFLKHSLTPIKVAEILQNPHIYSIADLEKLLEN